MGKHFFEYNEGICPFALGITMIDGYLYDIKLANYNEELNKDFDPVALWDLSYASILYDPNGKTASFMEQKLSKTIDISTASGLLWESYWSYKLAGDIWIYRQDVLQGHFVLNNAIKPPINALFVANKEYIPHEKWLIHMSRSLSWKPDKWDEMINNAISTGNCSVQSLIDRQQRIDFLWKEINRKLCEMANFQSELDFVQKNSYESLKRLIKKDEYTIDEWKAIQNLSSLNYEPTH